MLVSHAGTGKDAIKLLVREDAHNTIVTLTRREDVHQFVCAKGAFSARNRAHVIRLLKERGASLFEEETWRVVQRLRDAGLEL